MRLKIKDEILQDYPGLILGVAVAQDINNKGTDTNIEQLLRQEELNIRNILNKQPITEHPYIAVWRDAYRRFGAKPKDHPSSIENLARRVLKGQHIPHINKLVDIYNLVSLKHVVPAGGEDINKIVGDEKERGVRS